MSWGRYSSLLYNAIIESGKRGPEIGAKSLPNVDISTGTVWPVGRQTSNLSTLHTISGKGVTRIAARVTYFTHRRRGDRRIGSPSRTPLCIKKGRNGASIKRHINPHFQKARQSKNAFQQNRTGDIHFTSQTIYRLAKVED